MSNTTERPTLVGQVDRQVRPLPPLSDSKLLRWLRDNMNWDGHGYWLPEICLREGDLRNDFCPEPTMDEFRAALSERARAAERLR
jgi:hypothetical protein